MEDLYKDVPPVPDAENSVLFMQQITKQKPTNWPALDALTKLENLKPQLQLRPDQAVLLKKEMERSPATTAMVRKLADFPRGEVRIIWTPDVNGSRYPMITESREIAGIARLDALLRIHERDYDGALDSCRAILNAGRGNEPAFALLQMTVRQAIQNSCIDVAERALAHGQLSEAALVSFQNLLEEEMKQPLLLQGFRGERAGSYAAIAYLFKNMPLKTRMQLAWKSESDLLSQISALLQAPFNNTAEANETMTLKIMTELIETLAMPEKEQDHVFLVALTMADDARQPAIARMLLPAVINLRDSFLRSQARLRCAVAAIAAERYRHKHGDWPENLEALVPDELKQVGLDPHTGQPLVVTRLPDGMVISARAGGFRLWDTSQRRQRQPEPSEGPK